MVENLRRMDEQWLDESVRNRGKECMRMCERVCEREYERVCEMVQKDV